MNKTVIIGIGIAIIIAAVVAIFAVSSNQGVNSTEEQGLGMDEKLEADVESPEVEPTLSIEAELKQGIGIKPEVNP